MSEYAVNRQTGEVLKRDQSGSWQKVKSAKNASGEILINEGGGWGAVPSAQPAAPASPFLQKGMNMVSGAQATPPREPAAWEAGAREYVANMPERERAGILSSGDAALFNIANTLTAGGLQRAGNQVVPGKNLGDAAVTEGESYYPTASVLGRAAAYAVPSSSGGKVANMAVQDIVTATGARNLVPKGISEGTGVLARTTRYGGRLGTMAPTGALAAGAYEGIVEQPVRDFMAGEESTIGGRVRAGVNALANPINYGVLPAASAVGRVGKALVTGVATPGDVQRAVTAGSKGAVPLSEGQLAADAAQILDTQAMNAIDPRGFKLVERILRQSGLSDSDIPAVNAKVRELIEAAPDAVASRLTIGQVYAKALYDLDKTQAGENILKVLRERRNVTDVKDRSPSIVGKEVRDLRLSQVDFVTQSAESNLGAGKRIDIKNAVAETKKQIGDEYERVLAEADPTRPEARGIAMIVMGDASAPGILKRRAENAGFESVEAYVAARPDEAGHWLRSSLAKAARGASGREKIELETTVGQLDELLDTNAGYAQARQQYGTEIGVDEARDIGSNFIAAARNQGNLDLLLEQIAALPPRQRDVALLSIRDNLLSPVRGSGEDAPARIGQLVSVGTLEGLQRLGPTGKALADDIRAIRDENQFLGQIDSGNPLRQSATFSNADAAANAPDLYSGGIARTLNAGGGSSLPADIAISAITGTPIAPFTLAKIARGGLQSVFAPSRKSKEAMTQFLMSRPRNALSGQATAPDPADIMPNAGIAPGAERAAQQPTTPTAGAPAGPIRASGFAGFGGGSGKPPKPPADMPKIGNNSQVNETSQRRWDLAMEAARKQFSVIPELKVVGPDGVPKPTEAEIEKLAIEIAAMMGIRDPRPFLKHADTAAQVIPMRPRDPKASGLSGLRTDAGNAAGGVFLGGIAPADSDEERLRNMLGGAIVGGGARRGSQFVDDLTRSVGKPRTPSGRTVGQGGYFGRQSMRPPGSGPSAREIETQQQWATATPIVTQARTTAQSAQQAADAALQSKAPADIARAKDAKKTLVGQLQEAQASRAGMDTPEDARLAETLASLAENTSDPVLISTQISAAKTSLDRLLTDIGSPVEGNLIPVKTNILTRTQAPRSAAEGPQDRASVTRYAAGQSDEIKPQGFGASTPKTPQQAARMQKAKDAASVRLSVGAKATAALDSGNNIPLRASPADMLKAIDDQVKMTSDEKQTFMRVFGDQIRMSRGEAAAFFKTAADPRNHFSHNVEGFGAVAQRMTDEEIQSLSAATAPQVVTILEDLRRISPVQESAAVAVAGGAKKGWYLRSQKALQQVFGDDAPRFASVLAALSPQTSVESNLANAVSFWTNWTKAQRPTEEASILKILGQSVQGDKGEDSVLDAWRNNVVRSIQTENAEDAFLSGPKVDSFRRNLRARNQPDAASRSNQPARRGSDSAMNDTEYAVTNDAWMANYFNVDQELFARGGGKSQPGYSPGYLATNVYVREVADHLSKVTGQKWTPREVQETIWSWAKTLYEARAAGGETRSAAQLIAQRALTDLQIGGTPDFAILLKDNPALRSVLKEAGYEQQIDDLAGASGAVYGDAPGFLGVRSGPQDATGSGFGQRDYERRLGRAAGRLDDVAKRRVTAAREERVRTTRRDLAGDGGTPRAYTRGSGGDGQTVRFLGQPVAATYTPERAYQSAYAKNQIDMPDVHELPANVKAGAAYAKRMQEAASRSKFGAAVNVYSPEEYAGMRLFVAADGKSGFALKGDDIVSVWSDPRGPSGRTDALLPLAIQMGGRRLDAFNTVLPQIYAKHGFRIESRLGWNDEFAPTGWDKGTYARFNNGEPDVVFMVWDPAYKGAPRAKDGVRAASYEDALTAQSEAQKAIADRIALEYKAPEQPERRTVGKPKASQSARTVGKAKTN